MDTDDGLRLNYNMRQLLHDLISGEMSGVLPMGVYHKLTVYLEPHAVSEMLNLKIMELVNHEAYFKFIENYLYFVLEQNTEVEYALQVIQEEIDEVQSDLILNRDDPNFVDKPTKESYLLSLKCLTKLLPNIKAKGLSPPMDTSEIELNKEIVKLLIPDREPKVKTDRKRMELLYKLNKMDKEIKQIGSLNDIFSIEYLSNYIIRNAKGILAKMEKIRKWQKSIPWRQKRILEILLNSRNVPWKTYYNINSSFQNLLGNLAEIYNINFTFGIYWENLSTKINNKLINFIKINSIMEAEADDFKHNAIGFKYNNLIKPRIDLTKEANKMEDYKIQVLHAINYGNEDNIETLWNNNLRKNLDEKILIEFTKMREYMQEQKLMRKYLEEQIQPMKSNQK